MLDEKDGREWHLVGVAGGLPERSVMLFWDTRRPGFGRTASYHEEGDDAQALYVGGRGPGSAFSIWPP